MGEKMAIAASSVGRTRRAYVSVLWMDAMDTEVLMGGSVLPAKRLWIFLL